MCSGTSSRLFRFVMRMLATGANCLPAAGIGAISEQLASRLPSDAVRLGELRHFHTQISLVTSSRTICVRFIIRRSCALLRLLSVAHLPSACCAKPTC